MDRASAFEPRDEPLLVPKASPRKGRLWAILALLALGGLSLGLMVLWQRDATLIRKAIQRLEPYEQAVEAAISATGQLPLALPKTYPDGKPFPEKAFTYLPAETIRHLRHYDGPVLVGFSQPFAAALKADGRAGLWCEGGKCAVRWMSHADVAVQRKLQDDWVSHRQEELLKAPPKLP